MPLARRAGGAVRALLAAQAGEVAVHARLVQAPIGGRIEDRVGDGHVGHDGKTVTGPQPESAAEAQLGQDDRLELPSVDGRGVDGAAVDAAVFDPQLAADAQPLAPPVGDPRAGVDHVVKPAVKNDVLGEPIGLQRGADQPDVDPVVLVGPEPTGHHVELQPGSQVPGGAGDENVRQPVGDVAEDAAARLAAGAGHRAAAPGLTWRHRHGGRIAGDLDTRHLAAERMALVRDAELEILVAPINSAAERDRELRVADPLARVDVVAGVHGRVLRAAQVVGEAEAAGREHEP